MDKKTKLICILDAYIDDTAKKIMNEIDTIYTEFYNNYKDYFLYIFLYSLLLYKKTTKSKEFEQKSNDIYQNFFDYEINKNRNIFENIYYFKEQKKEQKPEAYKQIKIKLNKVFSKYKKYFVYFIMLIPEYYISSTYYNKLFDTITIHSIYDLQQFLFQNADENIVCQMQKNSVFKYR